MRCVLLAILGLAVMVLTLFLLLGGDSNRSVSRVPQPSLSLKLEIIEQDLAESVLKVRATANWNSQAPIEFRTPEDLALHNVDDDHPPPFMRTIELRVNGKRRSGYRGNDCFSRPQAPGYYVSGALKPRCNSGRPSRITASFGWTNRTNATLPVCCVSQPTMRFACLHPGIRPSPRSIGPKGCPPAIRLPILNLRTPVKSKIQ